jgi:hypothetical protein
MEPLTILSLASGIVQLIDFSAGFIRESHRLVKGSKATSAEVDQLAEIYDMSGKLCGFLTSSLNTKRPLDEEDAALQTAVELCQERLQKLTTMFEDLLTVKHKPGGTKSIRSSLKAAFNTRWKKDDIERLVKALDSAQQQLSNLLLNLIRRQQTLQHDDLLTCFATFGVENADLISAARNELLGAIAQQQIHHEQAVDIARQSANDVKHMKSKLDDLHQATVKSSADSTLHFQDLFKLQESMAESTSQARRREKCKALMSSLWFERMNYRKETISTSAEKTCEWVFHDSGSRVTDWLRKKDPLFCIFGKAGSGKSTLLKSISDDYRTTLSLDQWAFDSELIVAEHYFCRSSISPRMGKHSCKPLLTHSFLCQGIQAIHSKSRMKACSGVYSTP